MEQRKTKKIDLHTHVGNFGGWASVASDVESIIQNMETYEIETTVLCSSGPDTNEDTKEGFRRYPDKIFPTVYVNPLEKEKCIRILRHYIEDEGFRGIKMNPLKSAFVADDEVVDPVMELAEQYDVPVFIHSGHPPYSLPWSIAFLAERHPKVRTVMIHMGHGHGVYIDAALKMARRYPNLYLEMSGMPMGCKIKEAYDTVGKDRIMFGIDTPFHHPTVEIQKVLTSGLDEEGIQDVFYRNAKKFLGI